MLAFLVYLMLLGLPFIPHDVALEVKRVSQAEQLVHLDGETEFAAHEQEVLASKSWCSNPPGFGWSRVALRPTGTKSLPRQTASCLQVPPLASLPYFPGDLVRGRKSQAQQERIALPGSGPSLPVCLATWDA